MPSEKKALDEKNAYMKILMIAPPKDKKFISKSGSKAYSEPIPLEIEKYCRVHGILNEVDKRKVLMLFQKK